MGTDPSVFYQFTHKTKPSSSEVSEYPKNQVESVDEKGMVLAKLQIFIPSKLCFNGSRLGQESISIK